MQRITCAIQKRISAGIRKVKVGIKNENIRLHPGGYKGIRPPQAEIYSLRRLLQTQPCVFWSRGPTGKCLFCNVRTVRGKYLYTAGLVAILMQGVELSGVMNFAGITLAY